MKVLFLVDQLYKHGGIERILSIKANLMSERDRLDIYLTTTDQGDHEDCYPLNSKVVRTDLGIDYDRSRSFFHPVNLRKVPKHIKLLKKHISAIEPSVVVVCNHGVDTFFLPFVVSVPTIKEFHFSQYPREHQAGWKKRQLNRVLKSIYKKYRKLIVLNPDEKTYFKSDNVEVIPNPLTFQPQATAKLLNPVAISVGRIAPVKGFERLLSAWKEIKDRMPLAELRIFGPSEAGYLQKLKELQQSLGLGDLEIFKGSSDQIEEEMGAASVYLMSSNNECFPLVLLEAQSIGLPIVAFDVPTGPRNIVVPDSGYLIPAFDQTAYVEAVVQVLEDHLLRQRLSENALSNSRLYRPERIIDRWVELFEELINGQADNSRPTSTKELT